MRAIRSTSLGPDLCGLRQVPAMGIDRDERSDRSAVDSSSQDNRFPTRSDQCQELGFGSCCFCSAALRAVPAFGLQDGKPLKQGACCLAPAIWSPGTLEVAHSQWNTEVACP